MMKSSIATSAYPEPLEASSFTFQLQRKKFSYINTIGDIVEKRIPNFVEAWPLLGAYTSREAWHPLLDEDLELIGIAHYTILKSLSYIILNKDDVKMNDPDQKYKNVIFQYGLINDCIKQIFFHIYQFKVKLGTVSFPPLEKLTEEQFIEKLRKRYKKYSNAYDRFLKEGSMLSIPLGNSEIYISQLKLQERLKLFEKFSTQYVQPLRNTFIHNPSIDIVFWREKSDDKWEARAVRPEKIRDNTLIQNISKLDKDSLENPDSIMLELFGLGIQMLNSVWEVINEQLQEINSAVHFPDKYLNMVIE